MQARIIQTVSRHGEVQVKEQELNYNVELVQDLIERLAEFDEWVRRTSEEDEED